MYQDESLLNPAYVDTLEPYSTGELFCICPLLGGERVAMCDAMEEKTCVTTERYDARPGKAIGRNLKIGRLRRSADDDTWEMGDNSYYVRERLLSMMHLRSKRGVNRVRVIYFKEVFKENV